ncbi:MAG: hypothetical protein DRP42_05850 [Tenericutes bacterium]|nr:MAG: hypothetical protein DRP42_05850 [Mycoplasmatota bacterium]
MEYNLLPMRKVILNFKEEGSSIIEERDRVYFLHRGSGRYFIPFDKFLKNLYKNNPQLVRTAFQGLGIGTREKSRAVLTPTTLELAKTYLRNQKIKYWENAKSFMPKWIFVRHLWNEFGDNEFTLRDIINNIEPPPQVISKQRLYFNHKLRDLLEDGIVERRKDKEKSPYYLYRFKERYVEKFRKVDPVHTREALKKVRVL